MAQSLSSSTEGEKMPGMVLHLARSIFFPDVTNSANEMYVLLSAAVL